MKRKFILLLSMFLGSYLSAAAQAPAPRIVQTHDRNAPIVAMVLPAPAPSLAGSSPVPERPRESALPTAPAPSPAMSSPLPDNPGNSPAHFSHPFAVAYDRDRSLEDMESLAQMNEVDTLFFTRMSLPLVQLWGGRLRLEGFTSTLNMEYMQLGPSSAGGLRDFRPPRQDYPGAGPRSVDTKGISVTFHFGRNAKIGCPPQIWRSAASILGTIR